MSQSLLTTQTPSTTDNQDGGAAGITVATGMKFAVEGRITAVKFFATDTFTGTWTVEVWQAITGDNVGASNSRLAVKVASGVAAGWNTVVLDTPVDVTTGVFYRPSVNNSQGRYVHLGSVFSAADLVNGDITGPKDGTDPVGIGTMRNGSFALNSPPNTYPAGNGGAALYFVDVVFETDETITADLAGTLPALTGSLTANEILRASVAAALPALTGALTAAEIEPAAIAATLPALTGALAARLLEEAELAGTLPALVGSLAADVDEPGVISGVLPALTGSLAAALVERAQLAATLPRLTAALVGNINPQAELAGVLPALTGHLTATTVDQALPELAGTAVVRGLAGTALVRGLAGAAEVV